ncbi:Integrase catalytic domain-containing protein [Mycena kentingensis (nom. inval.)]|nr:Integrase catalytic domain-containing protein [Mycena kentingensis (nom. inval.)]
MSNPIPMPARGAHTAPKFDPERPEELRRYISDVEYLADLAKLTAVKQKKAAITRYLPVADQELLEGLESFKDDTKDYDTFKSAALALYAGNDENHLHTLNDLNALLGSTARAGIHSERELAAFHRAFARITSYLISKQRLSATEQSHAFLRALQPQTLQAKVQQRLQIVKPTHHSDDPYALTDLYDAAKWAIGGSSAYSLEIATATGLSTTAPTSDATTKTEAQISALLSAVTQLVQVFGTQNKSNGSTDKPARRVPTRGCAHCGDTSHFFRVCPKVPQDIAEGLCKKNEEGKLVLPNGKFLPASIEGDTLRERFIKWHNQNPGQRATTQLVVELATNQSPPPPFILTDEQRVDTLMAEVNALRTRMAARKALEATKADAADPKLPKPANMDGTNPAPAATKPIAPPAAPFPEHPYAKARDAAYAPPKDRNVGALPKPNIRPPPPICKPTDAREVLDAAMDSRFTITPRQLFSVAPEVRSMARDSLTVRRAAEKENTAQLYAAVDPSLTALAELAEVETAEEQYANDAYEASLLDSLPGAVTGAIHQSPPADGYIAPDPFATMFFEEGGLPEGLVVASDSTAIRSILPVVDNQQQIESIVDPGSQICAMSEAICHALAIPYDPTIVLQMQSANGSVTPSLGLARNVPFRVHDITLYLQVHVVRNPAYDILLGRPFDVLTQSVVHNYSNDEQTITIRDPNTGRTATVPTIPRGSARGKGKDFPTATLSQPKR